MSTVFYRWGAGRDESRVTFDGTHISVFDLKREIILANKMGNGKDFDLGVFDNVTGEEFKDDNHQIPRSSSLIARRLPSSAKGRGNAQNYITGTTAADELNNNHRIENHARDALAAKANKGNRFGGGNYGSMTKRFDGQSDAAAPKDKVEISTGDAEEDKRIQAFFAQSGNQWEQTQDDMALAPGRQAQFRRQQRGGAPGGAGAGGPGGATGGHGGGGGSSAAKFDYSMPPDKEPPVGYICYRCGQKGHWIQDCPTNDDPTGERKRFVRVTGIPRSFLKTVDAPVGAEGSSGGAMLTADGGFVMAVPDQRQWQKHASTRKRIDNSADNSGPPPELQCPIDRVLIREAVQIPCCHTAFCEECITTHLVEHDFECPQCESKVASLDRLKPDEEMRERVKEYSAGREEEVAGEQVKAEEGGGDVQAMEGVEADEKIREKIREAEEVTSEPEEGAISPTEEAGPASTNQSPTKTRPAAAGPTGNATATPAAAPVKPILDPVKMREMLNPQVMNTYVTQVTKMLQNPTLPAQAKALLRAQMQLVQATVVQMQMFGMMGITPPGAGPQPDQGMNNGGMGMGMDQQQQARLMGMGMGQNMGMGGMGNMGMNQMGMQMGMGMGMNGMGMMNQQQNMGTGMGGGGGFGGRGRGFARGGLTGGFRGRGNFGGAGLGRGGGHMVQNQNMGQVQGQGQGAGAGIGPAQPGQPGGAGGGRAPLPKRHAEEAGFEVPAGVDKYARMG